MLYRQACELRIPWDQELTRKQTASWKTWEGNLPEIIEAPRSIIQYQEEITSINLHAFGDASSQGLSAAVYAVSHQPSGISQGLVAAKSRLAKKGLTIPRLELVAGHMATNLVHNLKQALQGFPVTSVHCWLDSSVALHWIKGGGEYKQFVSNRVRKIQDKEYFIGATWVQRKTLPIWAVEEDKQENVRICGFKDRPGYHTQRIGRQTSLLAQAKKLKLRQK
ncbi:uncharacterized protein [Montipora foliosa]|uniref:uncharacterized protein n=1 Tax=Montipora foliosa TaxID=591990 RepID=UPI0035F14F84